MVKKIMLTQGQYTLVDDEDYEWLNQWKWYAAYFKEVDGFYARRKTTVNGKERTLRMHRVIMDAPKGKQVDHINHNTLDNRKCNLRVVSTRQNNQNRLGTFTSKYPGVYWNKNAGKWHVRIRVNGKQKHLGYFIDEEKAFKVYQKACHDLGEKVIN